MTRQESAHICLDTIISHVIWFCLDDTISDTSRALVWGVFPGSRGLRREKRTFI